MKRRLILILPLLVFIAVAGLLLRALSLNSEDLPSALIGKPMPVFDLPSLAQPEQRVNQNYFAGKPALLNVWATWCIACRAEHPMLNRLAQQGINVVGLNYKDQRGKALQWLDNLGNPYAINIYDEKGRLGLDLGVYGAPETYVVDSRGLIHYKHIGVVNEDVWINKLKPVYTRLLSEVKP